MENDNSGLFSDIVRIVFLIALCGVVVFGGAFIILGWADGALELIIRASVAASLSVAVYGGAALIYAAAASAARRRERAWEVSRENLLVPGPASYFVPCAAIVFFVLIWGIAMFGYGQEMIEYVKEQLQSGSPDPSVVMFLVSALTGPFGVISLYWLAFSSISYDGAGVRICKPFGRPMAFSWYEVSGVKYIDKKNAVTFFFSFREADERRASASVFVYEKEQWAAFIKAVDDAVDKFGIEVIPEHGRRKKTDI